MNANHTQQICEFCKSGECSSELPENLLMIFGLFILFCVLLVICCSISRRMNKKMKNIVDEDPDEKYIKIFDPINNVFIYYNNDNFFQKINNKFLKIPFDSKITNFKLKEGHSLFIWKRDEIFSKECYNYEYILDVEDRRNFKYSKDYELTEKFKLYCRKNEKVRYYVENL